MGDARESVRKVEREHEPGRPGCPVRRGADGTWEVRGYAAAREVLRATDTVQAGLGIETVEKLPARVRRPVLYQDGPGHREQRRQTARFFTPRRVDEHYRELMTRVAEEQTAALRAAGTAQLSDLSFTMAIEVVSDIIGLTHSRPGLKSRLERFFPEEFGQPGLTSLRGLYWLLRQNTNWLRIHLADVRPAIRAHRRRKRDDLISHLLAEGCSGAEILGECLTYAAAGMVTTREFICVAAWHLFDDPELLARYRAAEEPERLDLLREILRLEPAVGRLSRRATAPMRVGEASIGAGELLTVFVDEANADPDVVGRDPDLLRPGRLRDLGPGPAGLAFGDGAHRCPGAAVAVLEADVLLSRLFALDGLRMTGRPRVSFKDEIGGYEIRELTVTVPRPAK
ncbi:cytochrome P450 [Streptomyces sp. NBC_00015]|uniref:cytochrome P450 n=1 Tax=unclassified Streptomyces TaxID=2593676 RepID=UPI002251A18E|nr:cytochrome P450 [Streptomyces sp. NBC_00103]MCX5372222.1 cytochrome P450 [Streptomyces sp. NBC_00103]